MPPAPPSGTRRELLLAIAASATAPLLAGCASEPPPAPSPAFTASTDPARAPLVLPEPANPALPTLLLIGDSTVRNGHDDGQGLGPAGQWGWGHVLARAFDASRINVVNRAVGGLSSRTYRTSGHWERSRKFIQRGDVVLIQFGHNDSSAVNDNSRARGTLRGTGGEQQTIDNLLTGQRETVFSYGAYLRGYIAECRALGATPVLCTPVPRKRRDPQGRTQRDVGGYSTWAATVAREEGVALIDIDALAAERYDALGPLVVDMLFPRTTPEERVHTNWAGAVLNAQAVLQSLHRQAVLPQQLLPALAAPVAPRRLPTLFLVGDSTVRSGGQGGHWGWGERLAPLLQPEQIQLANHAMAGRSTRTFLREGRWEAVRAQLQPGDVVLIQFGHNDGGAVGDPHAKQRGVLPGISNERTEEAMPDGSRETVQTFGAYLTRFVRDALAAGAVPVVLSPIPHKDRWQNGRDFADFAAWGQAVAQREGAYFIDLTLLVTDAYRALGAAAVERLFSDARTHTNDEGARVNAACVVMGLRQLPQALLTPALRG